MILTNNHNLIKKNKPIKKLSAPDNRTNFKDISLNSRMSNVNSAIGLGQLENLKNLFTEKD